MVVSSMRILSAHPVRSRLVLITALVLLIASLLPVAAASPLGAGRALAAHTADPASVTLVGSLQSEAGCAGDWDPACADTHLGYDGADDVWQGSFELPAGSYEFKVALNDSWDENYGAGGQSGGANIALNLGTDATVKFYYDHKSHWITSNATSRIAVAPGSFQSELGCPGDWQPDCLRSWLQDPDGDGTYTFETQALPAGAYEGKVAIGEAWDENYGANGAPGGDNIPFTVAVDGARVRFSFVSATNTLTILAGHALDNNVEWDGLRHDSRSTLYRTPGGAVEDGTAVTLRLRTFANDVSGASVRFYSVDLGGQQVVKMSKAAAGVSCYEALLETETCDFWQLTLPASHGPDNLWYRFIVTDGTDTDYYADDTAALDGGVGAASDEVVDNSFALMVAEAGFEAPSWAQDAVIYQIFPDRFRNGRSNNDAQTGDVRYDDPVLRLGWGILPEGYCRNYADGNTNCPWRFDLTPPDTSPTKEQPRGRDYFGGDLMGVRQQLDYLKALGVNTIYFNPIFDAGSNHSYDTQDFTRIDPYFGTQKDWENLVKQANDRGMRIVLDGVFNHMSSDSPFFDRYGHYPTLGACESAASPYRSWFTFRAPTGNEPSPCAPSTPGGTDTYYDGWFGFDSIPVITKSLDSVQAYFLTDDDSIANRWLDAGAGGWRLDVSGDASFPAGYWETFRAEVKATKPDALTISETWQKDSTLLRMIRGDRLDTTMNYRLRDAVLGLLAPGSFDSKGFADSGRIITPSEFLNRLSSIREDYPDAAYYSLMNLLDSHDTERLLWTLTPGAETTADKELDTANVAAGKARVRLASLIQFTVPGAPTVYYGDEVGVTGDDDPDDRRTYPWADRGGSPDTALHAHYTQLAALRRDLPVLTDGDFRALLADGDVAAYGRRTTSQAAIVVLNRGSAPQTVEIPVGGYLRDGLAFTARFALGTGGSGAASADAGAVEVTVPANGALVLATGNVDLQPTDAPSLSLDSEGNGQVSVSWVAVPGAVAYDVWSSPLTGGGYTRHNPTPVTGTSATIDGLPNGKDVFVVVTATDAAGNVSAYSNEVVGRPRLTIGWANTQWPPTLTHTISTTNRTGNVYGQVWIDGETSAPGPTPSLLAQLGFGPAGTNPATDAAWTWVDASFNTDAGNNDEFVASLLPEAVGSFNYLYRYSTTDGTEWLYADLNGPIATGAMPPNPGVLTVNPSGDTTAPDVPAGLRVVSASPAGIELAWDVVAGDATLFGYEIERAGAEGGPYETIVRTTGTSYTDTEVEQGDTWWYRVLALDSSFNRSSPSAAVEATAELRTVTLQFTVTVPATTDATGRSVYIAGFLDRLDGSLPQWDPGGVVLSRVDATHWAITLTGDEGTQIEYKYALGSWDYVEKDAACGEIANRQLTLSYGTTGVQAVNDTAENWRNVAPCGN